MQTTDDIAFEELNREQKQVIQQVLDHRNNVLCSGPAGTGKSAVLKVLSRLAHDQNINFHIVGTTGIAAVNVSGMTLHAWAKIPLNLDLVPAHLHARNLQNSTQRSEAFDRITRTQILCIDEVSMLNGKLVDYIDKVFRLVRGREEPFGGIRLVAFGDFLQLAPVDRNDRNPPFAFEAEVWREANFHYVQLTQVYRQPDARYANFLSKLRRGIQDNEVNKLLASLIARQRPTSGNAVIVHTHNKAVDTINQKCLEQLRGESYTFQAQDWNNQTPTGQQAGHDLAKNCLATSPLTLVVGVRVMCLRNLSFELGIINGSCGTVIDFIDNDSKQFPTIPIVKFDNGVEASIKPQTWDVLEEHHTIATRRQIPLRLAYALTVHKSQGLTLPTIVACLRQSFTPGQGYVALSRSCAIDATYLEGYNKGTFRAHQRALAFYLNPAKYNLTIVKSAALPQL